MVWQGLIVVLAVGLAATASAEVTNPKVTTDGSIDCSSTKSIIRDVCKEGMSRQEKAIALFDFARRLMYGWPNRVDGRARHDTLHLLNTYGYSFCSQQALLTVHLWKDAGIKGYVWAVPGHSTMQAEYDGDHHWFDLLIGAYVYERDGKTIASLADIAKDKTLLTAAEKEGRAPKGFLPERTVLKDQAARFSKHAPDYIKTCADHVDDLTFMANLAPVAKKWRWGSPSPSRYRPDFKLRPGEKVTWLWDCLPDQANCNVLGPRAKPRAYWVAASELPPNHFYGVEAEKRDVNWKYFKPYVKEINGVKTGRYAANGRHVYAPDLRKLAKGAAKANSFAAGAAGRATLAVAKAGQPSELTIEMSTPHVYTAATITAEFVRARPDDVSRIYIVRPVWDNRKRKSVPKAVKLWDAADAKAGAGRVVAKVELKKQIRNTRKATIRFECAAAGDASKAGLNAIKIEAIFQHNMFARPYLVGGKNKVTVSVANGEALKAQPMTVTYAWKEAGETKTHAKKVAASPTAYTIDVAGKELPRMVSLEMAVDR